MSDITQNLGFDVSQALAAVKTLDAAFAGLQTTLTSLASTMTAFNSAGASVSATSAKVATGYRDTASAASSAQQSAEGLNKSFSLLAKITFTQVAIKSLRSLENAFKDAAESEIEYQTKIAEIRTLGGSETVDELSKSLRALSAEYNLPLLDVARSKYQLLSSGFVETADSVNILNASFKLAKVGVASAEQSIDLVAGTLNSFGQKSSEAEAFASQFFTAIQRGHLTAEQLSHSLSTVAPAAAALKVPLSEILAQFVSLSLAGTKSSQAATQINSVLSAMIKPSKDAKEALHNLGKGDDIRDIIAAYGGVVPVVKALVDQAKGNPEVLGKIFPNVRALREIFTLTNDGFERYRENLQAISQITPGDFEAKFAERMSGAAESVSRDSHAIKLALEEAFGGSIIQVGADLSKAVGGVENFTSVIKASGPVLLGVAASLTVLAAGFTSTKLGAEGLGRSLTLLAAIPLAYQAGGAIGKFGDSLLSPSKSPAVKAMEAELDAFKKNQADKVSIANKADQERIANASRAAHNFETLTGKAFTQGGFKSADDFGNTLAAAAKKAADLRAASAGNSVNQQSQDSLRKQIDQTVDDSNNRTNRRNAILGTVFGGGEGLNPDFQAFKAQFEAVSHQAHTTDEEIHGLLNHLGAFSAKVNASGKIAQAAYGADVAQYSTGISKLKDLHDLQEAPKAEADDGKLDKINAMLQSATTAQAAFSQAAGAIQSSAESSAAVASNWERAAAAAQQTAAAGGARGGVNHEAFGGMIGKHYATGGSVYLAAGGQARGTDTVPAMLSPGEFVMNAASTRKFYSQLTEMNADRPIYRAEGGPVTNNNINLGGFHAHSDNAQQTAREVMNLIRRETRRGSSLI